MLSVNVVANSDKFSHSEPFFEDEKYEGGEFLSSSPPDHCPDGSKLVIVDFGFLNDEKAIDSVSCFYDSNKHQLVIEHSWERGGKISEYSTIDDKRFGPSISKRKKFNFNVVEEYCDNKVIRSEVYSKNNEIIMISLYTDGESTPSIILDVNNPSNSKNINKISTFIPCDYEKFGIKNKTFQKWLKRDWYPLNNLLISPSSPH